MIYDKLIGEVVQHKGKDLGVGEIVSINSDLVGNQYIDVVFYGEPSKTKRFPFPEIFADSRGLLVPKSPVIKEWLEVEAQKFVCHFCGKRDNNIVVLDDKSVCRNCYSNMVECYECKKLIHPSEAAFFEEDTFERRKYYTCSDCAKHFVRCPQCGEKYYFPEREKYYPNIPDTNLLCIGCLEEVSSACSCCAEWYLSEDLVDVEDYHICKKCLGSNTIKCSSCGKTAIHNRPIVPMREIEGLCQECETDFHYKHFAEQLFKRIFEKNIHCIEIDFTSLKQASHESIMNRLSRCREPYAEVMLIHMHWFSLVMIFGNQSEFVKKYLHSNHQGNMSMSDFKRTNSYRWHKSDMEQQHHDIGKNVSDYFHLWKKPYEIDAKTDRVSNYGDIWHGDYLIYEGNKFGDTEPFFIIGSIQIKR